MQTFAEFWGLWLVLALIFGVYAIYNQFKRMDRMFKGSFDDGFKSMQRGLFLFMASGFLCTVSLLCFIISVIWLIVKT